MNEKRLIISCLLIILIQGIVIQTGIAASTDRNVIVGFRHSVGPTDDNIIQSHSGLAQKNFHLIPAIAATVPESKIAELRNDSNVLYVENDSTFKIADAYSDEYNNSWGVQHINSQAVHDHGINGTGAKVAVLDTGIDYTHMDLKDNYKGGYDFVNNDSDPWDDNCLTLAQTCHGTHVSGIIAAEKNGVGVIGVAPNASIYAVKVLDATGFGSASWIISGIQWAVDNKMNIISMSFAGSNDDISIHTAVDNAYNAGLLLVAAGGNTGSSDPTIPAPVLYPAAYDTVIAVTATDQNDQRAIFSPRDPKIELAAPGVDINSTIGSTINGGYGIRSGTSMAAPHVTGVAALLYSTNFPDVNNDGVKNNKDVRLILDNTAKDLGLPGRDNIYGYGVVDAQNAALGIPTVSSPPLPTTIFIPPNPINIQNTTGKFWVNYTWSPGIGNITDSYNVSANGIWYNKTINTFENITTTPGGFVNITVWAFNSSGKGSLSAGSISQNTQVQNNNPDINLTLLRTGGSPINDSKTVNLSQGNYTVIINNTNLSELDVTVYDNGTIIKYLSQKFEFNNVPYPSISYDSSRTKPKPNYDSNNVDTNLNIQKLLKVVFIPYGKNGTMCDVTIKKVI
jgi:subtilisin